MKKLIIFYFLLMANLAVANSHCLENLLKIFSSSNREASLLNLQGPGGILGSIDVLGRRVLFRLERTNRLGHTATVKLSIPITSQSDGLSILSTLLDVPVNSVHDMRSLKVSHHLNASLIRTGQREADLGNIGMVGQHAAQIILIGDDVDDARRENLGT